MTPSRTAWSLEWSIRSGWPFSAPPTAGTRPCWRRVPGRTWCGVPSPSARRAIWSPSPRTSPPYWQPLAILLRRQVLGHPEGRQLDEPALERRSPQHALNEKCAPVLIAHGVRDPRVPVAEVDDFAARARTLGVPVRYLRFDDEGHHVKSNANREILFREIEDFLEEHVHGR